MYEEREREAETMYKERERAETMYEEREGQ